jgi:two-component system, chemotaxis family, chemotaxis protein CheY
VSDFKLSVLVADDSSTIHAFFHDLAEQSPIPFEIVRAEDGRQCLEFLSRGDINLAFIDVNMPEMSGMEAIGVVRLGGSKTFVTLMSSNSSDRRRQLARQLKVYEFLSKPFTAEDVLRVLRIYCRVTIPTRALIVDDSATVRRIIQSVFTNSVFNIDVTEAGSGEAALACCASGRFDIIFLDCNMPGIDGLETLQRIMRHDSGAKVVMMTSERNEDRRRWALGNGAIGFLYKPFYASAVDRELHGLFGLEMPSLGLCDEKTDGALLASAAG